MPNFVTTANFGVGKTGLATVGYAIYNESGSIVQARTTSGVAELAVGSGIYRAKINYQPFFKGYVLWDTGDSSVRYASESINPIDADSMADEVRTMLRSLNTSLSSYFERLFGDKRYFDALNSAEARLISALADSEKKIIELGVKEERIINIVKESSVRDRTQEILYSFSESQKAIGDELRNLLKMVEDRGFVSEKSEIVSAISGVSEKISLEIKSLESKSGVFAGMVAASFKDIELLVKDDSKHKQVIGAVESSGQLTQKKIERLSIELSKIDRVFSFLQNISKLIKDLSASVKNYNSIPWVKSVIDLIMEDRANSEKDKKIQEDTKSEIKRNRLLPYMASLGVK